MKKGGRGRGSGERGGGMETKYRENVSEKRLVLTDHFRCCVTDLFHFDEFLEVD